MSLMTVQLSSAEVDQRLSTLISEMALLEREVRHLHDEVSNLERAAITIPEGDCGEDESSAFGEQSGTSEKERKNKRKEARALTSQYMPIEFIEELFKKRNIIQSTKAEYIKCLEDKDRVMKVLERNHEREDSRQEYLQSLYDVCGWEPGEKREFSCAIQPMDECAFLKKKLINLHHSCDAVDKQLHHATAILQDLGAENDALNNVGEDLFHAQTDLRLKEFEFRAVCEEIASYKRIYRKKITMLDGMKDSKGDMRQIKHLEAEKRVNTMKLLGHKNTVRQGDIGVRHRALLIRQLEHKIEMIGEAIREDPSTDGTSETLTQVYDSEGNPKSSTDGVKGDISPKSDAVEEAIQRVDSQLLGEVLEDIEMMRKEGCGCERDMMRLDAALEILDKKTASYEKTSRKAIDRINKTEREHAKFNALIDDELSVHEESIQYDIAKVMAEIDGLKEELRIANSGEIYNYNDTDQYCGEPMSASSPGNNESAASCIPYAQNVSQKLEVQTQSDDMDDVVLPTPDVNSSNSSRVEEGRRYTTQYSDGIGSSEIKDDAVNEYDHEDSYGDGGNEDSYTEGNEDDHEELYDDGNDDGNDDRHEDGPDDSYADGHEESHEEIYTDGHEDDHEEMYDDNNEDGHEEIYDDGDDGNGDEYEDGHDDTQEDISCVASEL